MSKDQKDGKQKSCFVISPIGEEGSEIRDEADWFLRLVREVLEQGQFNYQVSRADEGGAGSITMPMLTDVMEADLVVANLTHHNPNVFYELAVRHMVDRPFVLMATPDWSRPPFDTQDLRVITYSRKSVETWERAKTALAKHVEQIEKGDNPTNPISMARNWATVKESEDPEGAVIADFANQLASQKAEVRELRYILTHLQSRQTPPVIGGLAGLGSAVLEQDKAFGRKLADVESSTEQLKRYLLELRSSDEDTDSSS